MKIDFGKVSRYNIVIKSSDNNGFIVEVGCCTTVFNDIPTMLDAIESYLTKPEETLKEYYEKVDHPVNEMITAVDLNSIKIG